jgi:hypothetical protein
MTPLTTCQELVQSKEDRIVTTTRSTPFTASRGSESGFALILAILALLLLTFLGLTIATSTSTELQIATNYRWSQQALYNAEAGLEAAKVILSNPPIADQTNGITALRRCGRGRPSAWARWPPLPPAPTSRRATPRTAVLAAATGGGEMGYGFVLSDAPTDASAGRPVTHYENVNTKGQPLNGTFTIWVRGAGPR